MSDSELAVFVSAFGSQLALIGGREPYHPTAHTHDLWRSGCDSEV